LKKKQNKKRIQHTAHSTQKSARRSATVERMTKETRIKVVINLDGFGSSKVSTGIGFFDHMLELFAKRALFDLTLEAKGDLHVDMHHTVEDVGIALGQAVAQALGDKQGICRYASILLPMDESLAQAAIDISGRSYLVYPALSLADTRAGDFDVSLLKEFFEALVKNAGVTLHLKQVEGQNAHHVLEALFKAFGQVLGQACRIDPRQKGVPSTKGVL
jgi:imidazoleglycerol-phosphate dehydratase